MSFPPIEEVRSGLFLIRFTLKDIGGGQHTFHLRKCDYHPFSLMIECPEVNEGTHTLSIFKHLSNKIKTLPIGSNPLDVAPASHLGKNEDDLPKFVWIMQEGESKPIHLQLQSPRKELPNTKRTWGPLKYSSSKAFDLWFDFGTDTLGEKKILNQWARLLTEQNDTDVEFNVKGERMGAHAPVVMASSSIFASILGGRTTKTKSAKVVHISDIEPQVFQQLLHYIYTGRVPLLHEEGMAEQLFNAANKYGLDHLKDECARCFLADLTEHNVIETLIWSYKKSLTNLHDGALNYAAANYSLVSLQSDWQKLISNHPQICLRVRRLLNAPSVRST